jgi:hypothetical protein
MNDMRQMQVSTLVPAERVRDTYGRRREPKHPASEARRLIVRGATVLPVGRPLWLAKRSHPFGS